ncbi:MAG: 2-succinyl-5-enolpyruvyl-6-hydroxy-3-cyclohexene-1-carboxylic-acid synthase [Snowella sp.]|nr:2-succinyl-5-enolpyruvyl-6-hydroxy-3-cyclohexene-1-carboxylic-acid synthase [Snowella sp.]
MDFRNVNTLWASVIVETLYRLGLTMAVLCPGSRSSPLTLAFAQHQAIETLPILDERSAAFFALGRAKRLGKPVVIVCTSGTAGANFYPALIEAKESQIPLLVLTADRPPELRHCHAGQTIDQVKLYGHYPNWQTELAVPAFTTEMLNYLRQTLIYAWEQTQFPCAGVVHLNCPFREPLAPIPQPDVQALAESFDTQGFFAGINPLKNSSHPSFQVNLPVFPQRGLIIVGLYQGNEARGYCDAIAEIADILDYPVLAEALSPVRHFAGINQRIITTYDFILRNPERAKELRPEIVIQIGELPTSKALRAWLEQFNPPRYILQAFSDNFDPLHGQSVHLRATLKDFLSQLKIEKKHIFFNQENPEKQQFSNSLSIQKTSRSSLNKILTYSDQWKTLNTQIQAGIDQEMQVREDLFEGKITWLLSQSLPQNTPVFIANSMPIRDAEFFWKLNTQQTPIYFNRGANGIDGTLSTALGIAHQDQPAILLTGDLSLLHDTNGFLLREKFQGHLTIILINNNGGGIFEMLPITDSNPFFEDYFATPQNINFSQLATTYGVEYQKINHWQQLQQALNPLPSQGIRLLEIITHRKLDAQWLKSYLTHIQQVKS